MKLAVYTICKNEMKFVDNWINNVLPADYIVVLDTGSTDGTYERLQYWQKQYPDKIILDQKTYESFRFDVARNDNLAMVPEDTEIYLSTDLDELLTSDNWVDEFKNNWIEGKTERASYKYIWSHNSDGSPARVFYYNKAHSKNWAWFAAVHELLKSKVTNSEHYSRNVSVDLFNKVTLEHFPDLTKSRGSYLPLLKIRKEENPEDWYGRIYLANEYVYRKKYLEAIHEYQEILTQYQDKYSQVEKASCYLFSGDCYTYLSDEANAIEQYKKAIEVDPTYREGYIGLAKVLLGQKRFSEAREILLEGIKNSYRHFSWLERDTSYSFEPWDLLCQACFYSGEKVESLAYAAKALSYCPADERLKQNFNICAQTEEKELV